MRKSDTVPMHVKRWLQPILLFLGWGRLREHKPTKGASLPDTPET